MSAAVTPVIRCAGAVGFWVAFVIQVAIAVSVEVSDDLLRGLVSQHGTLDGIDNARQVVAFEAAHGFWIEPEWQTFFLQTRHIFTLTLTWMDIAHVMNFIYVGGHIFVTLGVALWVYIARRRYFVLMRNVVILTNALALVVYERFPVAPPRLTEGLSFDGHAFAFKDTVFGIVSGGKVIGTQTGYNEFSAMPSVHMGWALVVAVALLVLARHPLAWIFGVIYPVVMLVAIVVTGNHFLLDAVGAVIVVAIAIGIAWGLATWKYAVSFPLWVQEFVLGSLWVDGDECVQKGAAIVAPASSGS